MNKILYIVLDGLGDRPIAKLGGKTPLEAAEKPNMDLVARRGKTGLVYTVGKDIAPESDVAVISILGYDAHKYYTGRGPLESYAEGLDIKDGDVAFRVNFATVGEANKILDRRVGRNLTTEEATELAAEVNEKVKLTSCPASFTFKNTIGHRGVLVIRSEDKIKLSAEVTNTDPAYDKHGVFGVAKEKFENFVLECRPTKGNELLDPARRAAALTNEFTKKSTEILNASSVNKDRVKQGKLPGNLILMRDAGDRLPKFPPLRDMFKKKFGCFVEMPVEQGIALLTGMEIVKLPQPSGNAKDDYTLRAQKVQEVIKDYDILYIHLKGPDEPAHDGDFSKKMESIEAIDKYFFNSLLKMINFNDTVITVTADHSTPCELKAHSADPVPILLSGAGVSPDGSEDFSERACKKGAIGTISGIDIMPMLIKLC